jgi:hypothetical protein
VVAERARNVPEANPHSERVGQFAASRHTHAAHLTATTNQVTANQVTANQVTANAIAANAIAANEINASHEDPVPKSTMNKKNDYVDVSQLSVGQ